MSVPLDDVDDQRLMLFFEQLFAQTGYDFRDYSRSSMKRRISRILDMQKFTDFEQLKNWVYSDGAAERKFLEALSVSTTAMFRDPEVYKLMRTEVLPALKDHPLLRVWSVGCSTGAEVYSLAILLEEERLLNHARIYATDMNESNLRRSREGVFPMRLMREYTLNYLESGGCEDFSSYFSTAYDRIVFNDKLKRHSVFAHHNLVIDRSFNEFGLILCRNVLIYFNDALQDRVLQLLDGSLAVGGFLILGEKESLRASTISGGYQQISRPFKVYRKFR
jgi:chemotaxis protein methyltransferase CheR